MEIEGRGERPGTFRAKTRRLKRGRASRRNVSQKEKAGGKPASHSLKVGLTTFAKATVVHRSALDRGAREDGSRTPRSSESGRRCLAAHSRASLRPGSSRGPDPGTVHS